MTLVTKDSERLLLAEARDLRGRESSTAKFWVAIFHREFPADLGLYPLQEQPPDGLDRRRVDCSVYCFENGRQKNFVYVEFKRVGTYWRQRRGCWP